MAELELRIDGGVATLTLNRPQARNALSDEIKTGLLEALPRLEADGAVRAIVLTGAGGAFCAGGDLRGMLAARDAMDREGWRDRMRAIHPVVRALLGSRKPIVAAVDGPAFGAGFSLALTADIVLASPRASFCMSFLRVGLVPDFGALATLPRVVGAQRAKELILSTREVGADEALRLGIAMEVVPIEALAARAAEIAASFVHASPEAVGLVKRALAPEGDALDAALAREADDQATCFLTETHAEAVRRFLAREPAAFAWPASRT